MKCQTCGNKKAEIKLEYSGQQVCNSCFKSMTERRISKTIRKNNLISGEDKVAVAISGGKDSCLLLHWLAKYARQRGCSVVAIHAFRGDRFATKSLLACEKMCKELGVKLHVASFSKDLGVTFRDVVEITKKSGANRCSVCGVFRRRMLNSAAKKLGCTKLATGHNLTDEAQSYLMNFVRGDVDTFSHLGPISLPKRSGLVQRIKPLRDVPEKDIRRYVDMKGWAYQPEPCPCRVGSLRFNILDAMKELKKARPSSEFSIVKSGDWIREKVRKEQRTKNKNRAASTVLNKCEQCGEPCSGEVCRVCQLLALKD